MPIPDKYDSLMNDVKNMMEVMNADRVIQAEHRADVRGDVKVVKVKVESFIITTQKEVIDCKASRKDLYEKVAKVERNMLRTVIGIGIAIAGSIAGLLKIK